MKNQELEVEHGIGYFDFEDLVDNTKETEPKETEPKKTEEEAVTEVTEDAEVIESAQEETETSEENNENGGEEDKKETLVVVDQDEPQVTVYSQLAQRFIKSGKWQDVKLDIGGEEVILSEFGNLDEETFLHIQESFDKEKEEELKNKYINIEELNDMSKSFLEITKRGGNLRELIDVKEKFIDPLELYDLDNPQHQEALVRQKYHIESKGSLTKDDIDDIIENRKKNLTLDKEAIDFATKLKQTFQNALNSEKERLIKEEQVLEESLTNLKKGVREVLSSKFKLQDKGIASVTSLIPTKNTDPLKEKIEQLKSNPEDFAEFLFFLDNKDEYYKAMSEKISGDKEVKFMKTLQIIPTKEKGTPKAEQKEEKEPINFRIINKT